MAEVVARCPDCGMEQAEEFAHCFVCMKPSRWWCAECREWRPARNCLACGGGLGVPAELDLGPCAVGSTVAFKVPVRNAGRKLVCCAVNSPDAGVAITNPRIVVPPGNSVDVRGGITIPPGECGRRGFRLRFETPDPAETVLAVEAVAAAPRLDFLPAVVQLRTSNPGSILRASVALKNTGNVPLAANLLAAATWLKAETKRLTLAPGETGYVTLLAKSKKTESVF